MGSGALGQRVAADQAGITEAARLDASAALSSALTLQFGEISVQILSSAEKL